MQKITGNSLLKIETKKRIHKSNVNQMCIYVYRYFVKYTCMYTYVYGYVMCIMYIVFIHPYVRCVVVWIRASMCMCGIYCIVYLTIS